MGISMKISLLIIYLVYSISTLKCDTLHHYSTPHTKEYCTSESCVFIVQDDKPATKYAQEYNEIMNNILDAEENYEPCYYKNCTCLLETITNDLRPYENGITQQLIEDVVDRGTKFQIINHTLYREKSCLFPSRCNGIQYFLTQILTDLPDMEMVINCRDWPQISRLLGRKGPVFSFSRTRDYLDIMYPAWSFWEGGPAISLYPTGIGRWDKHRQTIKEAGDHWNWDTKENMAFFRGSRTSDERDALVLLSRQNPELVNAQYTKNQAWKSPKDTLNEAPALEISLEDHCQYKYLFNYRGIAASFRFKHLFLCKSLVFHVGDDYQEFFYRFLKPWIHYVPVDKNASQKDILNLIKFFHQHDDIAKRIAENGYEQIWNHLRMDDIKCYWRELLKHYASLIQYEVVLDPNLIKISDSHQ